MARGVLQVRMGHNDLGQHHVVTGNLNEALKCYMRTRDYGTTSRHTLDMCMHVIRVALLIPNYSHVLNYVSKAEQVPTPTNPTCSFLIPYSLLISQKKKLAAQVETGPPAAYLPSFLLQQLICLDFSYKDQPACTPIATSCSIPAFISL